MANGFNGLGLDTIIGGHHQNCHVRNPRPPSTHGGKGFVTRSIQEHHLLGFALMFHIDMIGSDVLGDAPGFALSHFGFADRIQEGGFPVIDVTHDRDYRRTPLQMLQIVGVEHIVGLDCTGFEFFVFNFHPQVLTN